MSFKSSLLLFGFNRILERTNNKFRKYVNNLSIHNCEVEKQLWVFK